MPPRERETTSPPAGLPQVHAPRTQVQPRQTTELEELKTPIPLPRLGDKSQTSASLTGANSSLRRDWLRAVRPAPWLPQARAVGESGGQWGRPAELCPLARDRETAGWALTALHSCTQGLPYLFFVNLLDPSHGLSQLLLLACEDDFCPVDAGGRDVDACPCLLHDLGDEPVVRPGDEGVERLLHFQPLHSAFVLGRRGRSWQRRSGRGPGTRPPVLRVDAAAPARRR